MLPFRLVLVRNIRGAGNLWSHPRFSSSKDGGDKGKSSPPESTSDSNNTKDAAPHDTSKEAPHVKQADDPSKSSHKSRLQDKSRAASLKLNELLNSMLKEETSRAVPSKAETVALSRPKQRKKKEAIATPDSSSLGARVVQAAQEVAHQLGGDKGQTQAELLDRVAHAANKGQPAAEIVAPHSLAPGMQQTRSTAPTKSTINLSELIVGMKIDRSQPAAQAEGGGGRAQQVRRMMAVQPYRGEQVSRGEPRSVSASMVRRQAPQRQQGEVANRAGLGEGVPLSIFAVDTKAGGLHQEEQLDTWEQLQQRELALAITHPPANIFEEMILWTNQGKLWRFPIDNEQGMEQESSVPFSEHVFLEKHIEEWCPKRGPIRHFMELVCIGLSKNPYLTVEAKKEHIAWYKEYFTSKQALLQEIGAIS